MKDTLTEVGIALLGLILTMFFKFVELGMFESYKIRNMRSDPDEVIKILAVHFDLLIIATSLIFGAYVKEVVAPPAGAGIVNRGKFIPPLLGVFVGFPLVIVISLLSLAFPELSNWFRVWIPDIIALAVAALAAGAVWR
jgi:hypothetical protein